MVCRIERVRSSRVQYSWLHTVSQLQTSSRRFQRPKSCNLVGAQHSIVVDPGEHSESPLDLSERQRTSLLHSRNYLSSRMRSRMKSLPTIPSGVTVPSLTPSPWRVSLKCCKDMSFPTRRQTITLLRYVARVPHYDSRLNRVRLP